MVVRNNVEVNPQLISDPRITAFSVGFATLVAQALLLREAMAAMGGSEMAWGLVMALWLAGMAAGARLGITIGTSDGAAWLPIVVTVLAGMGMVVLRAAPAILGIAPGEALTTSSAVWLWVLAIVPSAAGGGLAFPALAFAIGPAGGGRAYAFEASGALAGGIFLSFGLLHLNAPGALCLVLGALFLTAACQRRSAVLAVVAIAAITASIPAGGALARASWGWSDHPGTLQSWMETRYQQIEVSEGPPTSVYADGRLIASYPDPYSVLPRAHLLMLLHPRPRKILAIGCLADGSIEAMVRYPVDRLVVVEEDPDLLQALPTLYGAEMVAALDQPSVQLLAADPIRALDQADDWDLIILLDGNPTTLRRNRTRTLEFLRKCRTRMRPDGVLVMRVEVSDTYIGGIGGRLLSVLASTVREVFEELAVIPGEETLLVAGGPQAKITLNHNTLVRRFENVELVGAELVAEMVPILVDRDRSLELATTLPLDSAPNTIRRPRAVFLAGGLHEARALPGLLPKVAALERMGLGPLAAALAVAVLALLASAGFTRHGAAASAAAVGFCSMGWWLLLVASWQSTRGSVYSEIGALTALFMAGLAVGAMVMSRRSRPEHSVPAVLGAGFFVSVALATGVAVVAPGVMVPLLLVVSGLVTGAAFPGLTRIGSGGLRRKAGIVFAADEAGAALAAIVVGVLVIPWAGLTTTALGLAALQLAAIPAVFVTLRRR